jgi:hypothetical protein
MVKSLCAIAVQCRSDTQAMNKENGTRWMEEESLSDNFLVWAGELDKGMPNNKQKQMSEKDAFVLPT